MLQVAQQIQIVLHVRNSGNWRNTMEESVELTRQERLVADLVILEHRFPGGLQLGVRMDLDKAIEQAERLFVAHNLPMRERLVAELTTWRNHAENGVRLKEPCYETLHAVIQKVSNKR
jgi:hypothetical protein